MQAHFRFLCWCLCFKSVVLSCLHLIRAVFISYWKTMPACWGEEEGYSNVFENINWKLMRRGCYLRSLYLCGLCNPLLYFCHLTVSLASHWPSNVAENPLQPTGLKKHLFSLVFVQVGWLVKKVWLGLDPGCGWVPGLLHMSLILWPAGCPGCVLFIVLAKVQAGSLVRQAHFKLLLISCLLASTDQSKSLDWTETQGSTFHS